MPFYEHVFIARSDISAQQVETITAELTEILKKGGGKVTKSEYWGLRTLAYKIRKSKKGHYVLLNIDSPHPALAEMERLEKLNTDVVRSLTVRVEKLEDGPSIMMQKPERRHRDDDPARKDKRSATHA